MARQTITVSATDISFDHALSKLWRPVPFIALDSDFAPAGTSRFLSEVGYNGSTDRITCNFTESLTAQNNDNGEDLTDAWEGSDNALTFTQGSYSVTISGPTNASAQTMDANERYDWEPSAAQVIAAEQFFLTDIDTSLDFTITFDDNALPDASAPTSVIIVGSNDVDSEGTLSLGATVSGGTYDALAYAWDDGGAGGSFSTQTAATIYTAPAATSDTAVTLTCTVTATGDGTNANDGTSDEATGTKSITVNCR